MNKHIGMGNITRDLEIKTTQSGKKFLRFSLALPGYKKDAPATFINYVAWEKDAEVIAQYCGKGSKLLIESEFSPRKYEQDGQKRELSEFRVLRFEFAGGGGGSRKASSDGFTPASSFGNNTDEEIPF